MRYVVYNGPVTRCQPCGTVDAPNQLSAELIADIVYGDGVGCWLAGQVPANHYFTALCADTAVNVKAFEQTRESRFREPAP